MHEWILQLVSVLVAAGAAYGGIRADIRRLHAEVSEVKRVTQAAHKRIDSILIRGWHGKSQEKASA